jgi:lysophospholipase L1-like esterase
MQEIPNTRRQFIRNASLGTLGAMAIPAIVNKAMAAAQKKKIRLKKDDIILFQGDSITDAGRRKKTPTTANTALDMGPGYALMAASELLYRYPGENLQIYNRGISGNKVYQLAERWDADCLQLKPAVLSILVGVNDFWHTLVNNYKGTLQTYRDDYTALLERTLKQLPAVQLIIGEPYAVRGVKAVDDKWYPAFDEYRAAAREIAEKFNAVFIPYQTIYNEAQKKAPAAYWTADGVHPTIAGARLMAEAWLEAVKG